MNDISSGETYFHSINVKENWAHLAEKNLQPEAKITAIFRLS